jgi:hypothetical protein
MDRRPADWQIEVCNGGRDDELSSLGMEGRARVSIESMEERRP